MAEWVCRSCSGGFPKPLVRGQRPVCPWCAEPIAKQLSPGETQRRLVLRELGLLPQEETDDGGTDVDDTDHLQEGDTVTVELEGEVIDLMEAHDDLARIDVDSQKVEILSEEIIDIEHPDRPAGVQEVQQDG